MKGISCKATLLTIVAATSLFSCSDYETASLDEIEHDKIVNEYTQNFISRYGEIDPNHTWGFGDVNVDNMSTRANVPNKNEWYLPNYYNLTVPGWPDTYETDGHDDLNTLGKYHYALTETSSEYAASAEGTSYIPAGDVTDEEIQYVSWWFRTHKPGASEIVHWTDFFIQYISADNDRNPDGTPYSTYEINDHGTITYNTNEKFTIDQLKVKTFDSVGDAGDGYDHIYNFNSNNSNHLYNKPKVPMLEDSPYNNGEKTIGETPNRLIQFYTSSGTEDFQMHYSNDDEWRQEGWWTIQHLTFTGPSGRKYDGYYLGFDYAFHEDASEGVTYDHPRDYYFSNCIVKITPATPIVVNEENPRRVMCEDLGNTLDFDFNDVVFDVYYDSQTTEENGTTYYYPLVTIQATGATKRICVGVNDDKHEVHYMLGNQKGEYSQINVEKEFPTRQVANFRYKTSSTNPDDIPIYVDGICIPSPHGNLENYKQDYTTAAPQKFCVPCTVKWLKEYDQIENGYPLFDDWVRDDDTYKDSWYKTEVKDAYLCNLGVVVMQGQGTTSPSLSNPYEQFGTILNTTTKDDVKLIKVSDLAKYNNTPFTLTVVYYKRNSNEILKGKLFKREYHIQEWDGQMGWSDVPVFSIQGNENESIEFSSIGTGTNGILKLEIPGITYSSLEGYEYLYYNGQNPDMIVGIYIKEENQ